MRRPLSDVRVLDIGMSTAGPYAARLLGDLGADVIKVEPLDGENTRKMGLSYGGASYLFHVNNYNKRSISLKLQDSRGRDLFLELVRGSDVVVENFATSTMDKWGVGYEACRAENPSIIYCSIKGFGDGSALKDKRAFDTVVQAMCGIMHSTGLPDDPPLKAGPSVCDVGTAISSAMAVVCALAAREKGRSQLLDLSMFDTGALSLLPLWPLAADRVGLERYGNKHHLHVPFGDYVSRNGRIFLTVTSDQQWAALARLLTLPPGWSESERKSREPEIDAAIEGFLATRDGSAAVSLLQEAGIPAGPVNDLEQLAHSELMKEHRMVRESTHAVYGKIPLLQSPLPLDREVGESDVWRPQPTLGQHNDEIIGDLLGHRRDLDPLRAKGVIG